MTGLGTLTGYDGFETKTATALEMIQTGHMMGLKLRP